MFPVILKLFRVLWECLAPILARSSTHGHQVNRQHLLQEMCTQEVPPPQLANTCYRVEGNWWRYFMKQTWRPLSFTILDPRLAGNVPTVDLPSSAEAVYPRNFTVGKPKNHTPDLQFEKIPTLSSVGRRVSKQTCVQVQNALDQRSRDPKTSRSIFGSLFPNLETLDAKIASFLKKINFSHFSKRVYLEEQQAQKDDRFFRGRQIAFTVYEHFRVTDTRVPTRKNFTWRRCSRI